MNLRARARRLTVIRRKAFHGNFNGSEWIGEGEGLWAPEQWRGMKEDRGAPLGEKGKGLK